MSPHWNIHLPHAHGGSRAHSSSDAASLSHPTSAYSSRPSSRAPSPTRTNTSNTLRSARGSVASGASAGPAFASSPGSAGISTAGPSGANAALDDADPLNDYFSGSQPGSVPSGGFQAGITTPGSDLGAPPTHEMWGGSQGPQTPGWQTPGGSHLAPISIILDSEHLTMRGQGSDHNPAYLSGRVELDLHESMNVKEVTMSLTCKAKVAFSDPTSATKSHHYSHPMFSHDWSFLQGDKRHTHTLKAGHHSFPFSLMLEGNLPSSISTYNNHAHVVYKLRANVVRSGFAKDLHSVKTFTVHRTYTPEALEFNQTLEIENTWPGKIMYAITLPFKAYAAGDDIPVNVKFMPLAKGVRVTNVTSVLKEYTLVHTRHSSHPDERVAASVKYKLEGGRAYLVSEEKIRPPIHQRLSTNSQGSFGQGSRNNSYVVDGHSPLDTPAGGSSRNSGDNIAGPSSGHEQTGGEEAEDPEHGDDEVDTSFTMHVPSYTTPSHAVHPIFVSHKIKWSCSISNPDGHVSELRCALPILILDHSLLEEARTNGAPARGLLFGGNPEDVQQVDLPSYSNHVYDRVAIADSGPSMYRPRSGHSSPSASGTPAVSRGPSRPGSPAVQHAHLPGEPDEELLPPRPQLSGREDAALLASLGVLSVHSNSPAETPSASRGPSRPLSRRNSFNRSGRSSNSNSRPGSRPGSRANSPDRNSHAHGHGSHPHAERRTSGFHIHGFKGMKALASKPILKNVSNDDLQRQSHSFSNLAAAGVGQGTGGRVSFAPGLDGCGRAGHMEGHHSSGANTPDEVEAERVDPINRVPSYDIAARGFLGGGVTPLDSNLPTYDVSERLTVPGEGPAGIIRPRSDTDLVQLGAAEAAAAEQRARDAGEAGEPVMAG